MYVDVRTPFVALVAATLIAPTLLDAQQVTLPRLGGAVTLDGHVVEDAWRDVPVLDVTMFEPDFGGDITRTTSIRLAHDGEFIYGAGIFVDDAPPTGNGLGRDFDSDDDVFNLVLDTFRDRRSALWFAVNPAGARLDGAITDDTEGDAWNHVEYDSYWDAEAVVHPWGWSAEIRIPLSSLRFQSEDGRLVMGMIVGRKIARLRERHTFPAIRPGPSYAQFKPSLAATVVLEGVEEARPRTLTPFVVGGVDGSPGAATFDWRDHREIGGDVKVGLTPNLTLDVTVNTDFAQTEADDQRVNLTRFGLLYPEKRRFFLERAGAFDFGDGLEHRIFHSRRIGLTPGGEPVRVYGGARLVGQVGAWDLGALSLQTAVEDGGSTHASALRVRRALGGGPSWWGGAFTSTVRDDGRVATGSGVDADVALGGGRHLSGSVAMSSDTLGRIGLPSAHARLLVEDRDRRGFAWRAEAVRVGPRYEPPLGFVLRRGTTVRVGSSFGAFGGGGPLQERVVSAHALGVRRDTDGALETGVVELAVRGVRRGGGEASAGVRLVRERLDEPFELGAGARIATGVYDFVDVRARVATPGARKLRSVVEVGAGDFFDGHRWSLLLQPGWTVSRHLDVSADLEMERVRFPERADSFDAALVRLRVAAALDRRLSGHALVQYDHFEGQAGVNVRVRYNFREGRDLYVVLNGGRADDASGGGRDPWRWTRFTLLAKYAQAVQW